MTIQTPETQTDGFIDRELIFRYTNSEDYRTIDALNFSFAVAHACEAESAIEDFDYENSEEYSLAFEEESLPERHLHLVKTPITDLEIVRQANIEGAEIGESSLVRSLSVEERVRIANLYKTSLVVHEDDAEALVGIVVAAEKLAEDKNWIRLPEDLFRKTVDALFVEPQEDAVEYLQAA